MSTLPDISALDATLYKLEAMMGASESHGALCGMLCAHGTTDFSEWMSHVLGEQEQGNVFLRDATNQLSELHRVTLERINDAEADFHLLLPDDDDDLVERTEALAAWCQGFVYGLAAGGINANSELPEDTRELLMDFIEISRAGHETGDAEVSEEDELAFVEVMEYVRTGVLLINEELQPLHSTNTLH